MRKNVIYVDFVFKHKKVTHFNFYITFAFFILYNHVKLIALFTKKDSNSISKIKNSNKYINLQNYDKILRKTSR